MRRHQIKTYKIRYLIFACLAIFYYGCGENAKKPLSIEATNKTPIDFGEVFEVTDSIIFDKSSDSANKILTITKVLEFGVNKLILLDQFDNKVYLFEWNKDTQTLKLIARKGRGPGEFTAVCDITDDNKGNLYVLDFMENKVGKFNASGEFIKNFQLSFDHRFPESIQFFNNGFIIAAYNNLAEGASRENYTFLPYKDVTFLNFYNLEFKLEDSFLSPYKEYTNETDYKGSLKLPVQKYSPFTTDGKKIYCMLQNGINRLKIFNKDRELEKIININSNFFREIKTYQIEEAINLLKQKDLEGLGRIRASYTSPTLLYVSGNFLVISLTNMYENYYPMFLKTNKKNTTYYDVLSINQDDDINLLYTGIAGEGKTLVGRGKEGLFYFVKESSNKLTLLKCKTKTVL